MAGAAPPNAERAFLTRQHRPRVTLDDGPSGRASRPGVDELQADDERSVAVPDAHEPLDIDVRRRVRRSDLLDFDVELRGRKVEQPGPVLPRRREHDLVVEHGAVLCAPVQLPGHDGDRRGLDVEFADARGRANGVEGPLRLAQYGAVGRAQPQGEHRARRSAALRPDPRLRAHRALTREYRAVDAHGGPQHPERPCHGVVGRLRVAAVVDGRGAPGVRIGLVQLPRQHHAAVRPPAPVRLDGVGQACRLQQLAGSLHPLEAVEATAEAALHELGVVPPFAEVTIDRVRAVGRPSLRGRDERFETAHVGHALDAELGVGERGAGVVQLVMRDEPLVLPWPVYVVLVGRCVPDDVDPVVEYGPGGRGRDPVASRIEAFHDAAERGERGRALFVERDAVVVRLIAGELVASAPQGERGVVGEAGHDRLGLGTQVLHEVGIGCRRALHAGTGLRELLPYKQARAVAGVVELLAFDEPPAPDPKEARAGPRREVDEVLDSFQRDGAIERISRDPVPADERDALAVHDGGVGEGVLRRSGIALERKTPEADSGVPGVILGAHAHRVELLPAEPVRPPRLRRLDGQPELIARPVGFLRGLARGDDSLAVQQLDRHGPGPGCAHDHDPARERRIQLGAYAHIREQGTADPDPRTLPDSLVPEARAEVPAVTQARSVDSSEFGPAYLRLGRRGGVDHNRESVGALGRGVRDVDPMATEDPLHEADFATVDEHRRGRVDPVELEHDAPVRGARRQVDPAAVHPRALRHPLRRARVSRVVGIRQLPRPVQVGDDRTGNGARQPAGCAHSAGSGIRGIVE